MGRISVLIRDRFNRTSGRTKNITQNILLSLICKSSNILCSLLIVPLTIDYIDADRYGIWLTVSSIVGWILFFDLGLGNGFRNHFVKARAANDIHLCRKYVSTTYFAITFIVSVVWLCAIAANYFIDWPSLLKVSPEYREELTIVVFIVLSFTSLNMIVNLFGTLLTADLKPGFASLIGAVGQWIVLGGIIILRNTTDGSLTYLALVFSGVPAITMALVSTVLFLFSNYRIYRPTPKLFEKVLLHDIMGLGLKFFLIYICMIAVFQVINMVISREVGPMGVTQYNIANKYFSILFMVVTIIVQPIWSVVTDAYVKKDLVWLEKLIHKLDTIFAISIIGNIVLLIIAPFVYEIWIGDSVDIPYSLSIVMAIFVSCQTMGTIYVSVINGIGAVRIQCITYVLFAILSWPLFTLTGRTFGLTGIVFVPALANLALGIISKVQIHKIMNGTANGVWLK